MSNPDLEGFRRVVREWVAVNAIDFLGSEPAQADEEKRFRRALWGAGFLGLTLDRAYGGRGLSAEYQEVFDQEARRSGLTPLGALVVTTGICAPTLLDWGTEEQKRQHLLRMIRGDETWAQLLSEPGAGTDLAGLETKATADGDEFVLSGQKVWTSSAMKSDYALCIARSNAAIPKRAGLSMFIVDLKSDGVTIRPLRQMTGESEFNEVFLDDVRVPRDSLVGQENDGWRVLMTMLTHERLALGAGSSLGGGGESWSRRSSAQLARLAQQMGKSENAVVRQELAKLYVAEKVLQLIGQRMRDSLAAGVPVGAMGSVAKLITAAVARQASGLGMAISGVGSTAWRPGDVQGPRLAWELCRSPLFAIAGGTSEIQRNTISERVLGLPKEPQIDGDLPFTAVQKNDVVRVAGSR